MSDKYQALRQTLSSFHYDDDDGLPLRASVVRDLLADHDRLQAQVEQLRTEAKVASDRIQELGRFTKAQTREIEGLRADLSRAECNRDMWEEQCARQAEQLETGVLLLNAAQAQVEGLRADAQRYRWIRDHCESDGHAYWLPELCVMEGHQVPTTQDIDAAIDSARAGREGGNGR